MSLPQTWEGGSTSFKVGSLKRRLPAVVLVRLDPLNNADPFGVPFTQKLVLKNLNGDLKVQIAAAFSSPTDGTPIDISTIPAGAATIQLTPAVLTPNAGKIFLRPVFQDPTAAQNENHPLPQDLPFGWEFSTEADEVYIEVVIDPTLFAPSGDDAPFDGQIVISTTIEYDGNWWSTEAIKYAISQVQLTGVPLVSIGTAAG